MEQQQQQQPAGLLSDIKANPVIPDDRSTLQPHGEQLKRGTQAPEFNPNAEFVDTDTQQMRPHGLAEVVAAERPVLDDQQSTPFHTTDKGGVHRPEGATAGGGHGL
ncbi:hypothetical protein GPECTOR_68g387 [Gonium pectorale]|uniref:Uncharacterized protein n=1 Tax=Gonium pectorale TaxID=33097 RepID=A0A150G4G0_GONPE|nr:hypothetical protein GPECTOR_68g387 [Gonium pectorale]|eukprot:KXZ44415.1 hypothetical protein GPECTOR_68g387 [Gonium pectorale]